MVQSVAMERWAWIRMRVRRHMHWAREGGWARLIEEDDLRPIRHLRLRFRKWRWRRSMDEVIESRAAFVVGVQRSGTNMLVRALEEMPEVEVHNENDPRAFDRFRLRDAEVVSNLIERSKYPIVLFKPLCDSHRTPELLDAHGPGAKALWVFRDVDDRARSAVRKFGDHNLNVIKDLAKGRGLERWQVQGLSNDKIRFVQSLDLEHTTPESASALFWYLRNSLFFDLTLDRRDDVLLVPYDEVVVRPEDHFRYMCDFLSLPFRPVLTAEVTARHSTHPLLALDEAVRAACTELTERLVEHYECRFEAWRVSGPNERTVD